MQLSILRSLSRQPKRAFPNPSEDVAVKHNDLFWFCTPESRSCGAPLPNQHKVAKDAPLKSRQPWENCRRHARARLLGADCWGLSPALPPNRLLRITRQTRRTGRCVEQTTRAWSSSARGRRRSPLGGVSAPMREHAASSGRSAVTRLLLLFPTVAASTAFPWTAPGRADTRWWWLSVHCGMNALEPNGGNGAAKAETPSPPPEEEDDDDEAAAVRSKDTQQDWLAGGWSDKDLQRRNG